MQLEKAADERSGTAQTAGLRRMSERKQAKI